MSRTSTGNNKGTWSVEEDKALLDAMDEVTREIGHVKWCLVAKRLPSRSPKQCRERFVYNLDPKISKAPWTKEEDAFLLFSQKHLGNAWARIASCLPGRTENSTKTRFKSIMRAQKRIWKKHEDDYILSQYSVIGSQWDVIAQGLTGRTKNAIKTRFFFLTEGIGSTRTAASSSRSSNDDDDDDYDDVNNYVGSPCQALGLSDAELAQISASLSQKLAMDMTPQAQTASKIDQETVKAAIAQPPKVPIISNKRERPVVLKKTMSKSSMAGDQSKYVLETPKNTIIQAKSEISPPFNVVTNIPQDIAMADRQQKRRRMGMKVEPVFSNIPPTFHATQLIQQRTSIENCLEFLQQHHHHHQHQHQQQHHHQFQYQFQPPEFHDVLVQNAALCSASKLTSERPSFIDFIGVFDYNSNHANTMQTAAATAAVVSSAAANAPSAHDEGFTMSLGDIEPITWNP